MTISTYPQITVYVSEKPALKEDCDTIAVNTINEVKVMLWALAKQAKPEWAMAFLPMGIEPMTNDGMRHADIPANIASEVEKEVLRLDRLTMDSIVTEALNPFYDELASLFATRSNFVELLTNSAKDWGKECEQVVYRSGPMKFELFNAEPVVELWIKKTQDIKHWNNCTKGESKWCACINKRSRS